jgi:hypothetical protein
MILKVLARHSPSSQSNLIEYMFRGGDGSPAITQNVRSDNVKGMIHEFTVNESFRKHPRKQQVYLTHEILSFSANEDPTKYSDAMMRDITQKYLSLRGKDAVCVAVIHTAKDNMHAHIAVSGVGYRTGLSMRLARRQLADLKIQMQQYHLQQYPQLTESTVNHGKGHGRAINNKEWQARHRDARNKSKEAVTQIVQACFVKAKTQNEFLSLLQGQELHHYERGDKIQGIIYQDIKFRFLRLGISQEQLDSLPMDRKEEQKALNDIRRLREIRKEQDRNIEKTR